MTQDARIALSQLNRSAVIRPAAYGDVPAIVDAFTVTNVSGGASQITIHVVPAGDTPSADNCIVKARGVAVNESYSVTPMLGHVVESGAAIWCVSVAGNALVLFASGRVIT